MKKVPINTREVQILQKQNVKKQALINTREVQVLQQQNVTKLTLEKFKFCNKTFIKTKKAPINTQEVQILQQKICKNKL